MRPRCMPYPAFDRGDRGGNDILVPCERRARRQSACVVGRRARLRSKYRQLEALARDYGRSARSGSDRRTIDRATCAQQFQAWAKQSRALAASDAYTPEVRAAVAAAGDARQPSVVGQRRDIARRCTRRPAARSVWRGVARPSVLSTLAGREFAQRVCTDKCTEARDDDSIRAVGQRRRAGRHGGGLLPRDQTRARGDRRCAGTRRSTTRLRARGVTSWTLAEEAGIDAAHRSIGSAVCATATTSSSSGRESLEIEGVHDTHRVDDRGVSHGDRHDGETARLRIDSSRATHRAPHGVRADR